MKKLIFAVMVTCLSLVACQSSDQYKELPSPIATFVSNYWPNPAISSYTHPSKDVYEVIIKNGATIEFDGDYAWTSVDGNGMPLPEILLYDQLPAALYQYLSSGSMLDEVFSITRTPRVYTLQLLNSSVEYDIATQAIKQL